MSVTVERAQPPAVALEQFVPPGTQHGRFRESRPSFRDRIAALNELSKFILSRDNRVADFSALPGIAYLAGFLQASNLEELVRREIPNPDALERFVPVSNRKSLRLVPRGTVCHWLAGNVPLLGMFSWAVSALVGNLNIIRLSSRQENLISPMLQVLAENSETGRLIAEESIVLQFDRDDDAAHRRMSELADVRIAWGGQESIDRTRLFPSHWQCEDIFLGPRSSLAVVDPSVLTQRSIGRLVSDIIYFDQWACSSPQTLYVKGKADTSDFEAFISKLRNAFETQTSTILRHSLDSSETYQIQLDRARILLNGGSLVRDSATRWTVAMVEKPHREVQCANCFVQLVAFDDFNTIYENIPTNVQTIVTQLSQQDQADFTEAAVHYGVCRFPRPGEGNNFEMPWDGIPLLARLTRWVTRSE